MDVARCCPWCGRWALKDEACNWVCCGLDAARGFVVGGGCGGQWCFVCSRRLCGKLYDAASGQQVAGVGTSHSRSCCLAEATRNGMTESGYEIAYCQGGHNSHR